jgi:hypothetical protein
MVIGKADHESVSRATPAILCCADQGLDLGRAKVLAIGPTVVGVRLAARVSNNAPQKRFDLRLSVAANSLSFSIAPATNSLQNNTRMQRVARCSAPKEAPDSAHEEAPKLNYRLDPSNPR